MARAKKAKRTRSCHFDKKWIKDPGIGVSSKGISTNSSHIAEVCLQQALTIRYFVPTPNFRNLAPMVCACVDACVCVCMHACMCVCVCVGVCLPETSLCTLI